jgi:hypothetical protein
MGRGSVEAMTETVPDAATALPRLSGRWPTTLGLVQAGGALFVIFGLQGEGRFAAGVAAMVCIYMAAYAAGRGIAAWPAYLAVIATWVIPQFLGIDPRISMASLVIAGLGRFAHGLWGACNVAKGKVVRRPWSEMCVVAALR